jgi:uncharacterized membrane protein
MKKYIFLFLITSLLGWVFEYLYDEKKSEKCGDSVVQGLNLCLPMHSLYGIFAIIMLGLREYLKQKSNFVLFITIIVLIGLFECIIGKVSKIFNGKKKWDYTNDKKHFFVMCDGYISMSSVVVFGVMSFLYFKYFICEYF